MGIAYICTVYILWKILIQRGLYVVEACSNQICLQKCFGCDDKSLACFLCILLIWHWDVAQLKKSTVRLKSWIGFCCSLEGKPKRNGMWLKLILSGKLPMEKWKWVSWIFWNGLWFDEQCSELVGWGKELTVVQVQVHKWTNKSNIICEIISVLGRNRKRKYLKATWRW